MILMFLTGAGVLMMFWVVCTCPEEAMFEFGENPLRWKASRTFLEIYDMAGALAGVDEDYGFF